MSAHRMGDPKRGIGLGWPAGRDALVAVRSQTSMGEFSPVERWVRTRAPRVPARATYEPACSHGRLHPLPAANLRSPAQSVRPRSPLATRLTAGRNSGIMTATAVL